MTANMARIPEGLRRLLPRGRAPRAAVVVPSEAQAPRDFGLVRRRTDLRDRAEVERYLPDILGRALARIWIDPQFGTRFALSPKDTLADYDVHLPETIDISLVTENQTRPRIVVHEQTAPDAPRRRVLYLQLVMVAGH